MKIETTNSTDNSIKTKIERLLRREDGAMFSDMLAGEIGYTNYLDFANDLSDDTSTENLIASISDFNVKDLKSSYKYDCMSIDRDDAMFFANAVKNGNCGFTVNGQILTENLATSSQEIGAVYKSAEVSKTLMNMIENAQSTQKPVRSNIAYLQQAFEEQEIPYNELSYRPKQQQRQQNQQNQNQNGYKQYQEANDEGEY